MYRTLLFDPQIDLFEEHEVRELTRWHRFQQEHCFAGILQNPAGTLCILERVGLIDPFGGVGVTSLEVMFERIALSIEERYCTYGPAEQ